LRSAGRLSAGEFQRCMDFIATVRF
jgi:hypothetical protein